MSESEGLLARLERQVERGSLFTHTAVSRNAERLHEAESFLFGVIDALIEKGLVTEEEVAERAGRVRRELDEAGQTVGPGIALRVDAPREEGAGDGFVAVDCAERIHVCRGVCCRLHFALTAEEVESGDIKWDLGQPYYVRKNGDGCCVHQDPESRGCSAYDRRPGICRTYSCAGDARIWKDFEGMVLNQEWIDENLRGSHPRLAVVQMVPEAVLRPTVGEEELDGVEGGPDAPSTPPPPIRPSGQDVDQDRP